MFNLLVVGLRRAFALLPPYLLCFANFAVDFLRHAERTDDGSGRGPCGCKGGYDAASDEHGLRPCRAEIEAKSELVDYAPTSHEHLLALAQIAAQVAEHLRAELGHE